MYQCIKHHTIIEKIWQKNGFDHAPLLFSEEDQNTSVVMVSSTMVAIYRKTYFEN